MYRLLELERIKINVLYDDIKVLCSSMQLRPFSTIQMLQFLGCFKVSSRQDHWQAGPGVCPSLNGWEFVGKMTGAGNGGDGCHGKIMKQGFWDDTIKDG